MHLRWESTGTIGILLVLFTIRVPATASEPAVPPDEIRAAISRAIPLLEVSAREFTKQRECFSCHHQTLPVLAMVRARFATANQF